MTFTFIEDYERSVCDGRRIGQCIAIAEREGHERTILGHPMTFCLVVWGAADDRIHLSAQRWSMEWVAMDCCHPVEIGNCDNCEVARRLLIGS